MTDNKIITVLGWGSLIWEPKDLSIRNSDWKEDGPYLPIEFARKSLDGRVTLVLYDDYVSYSKNWVRTLWNIMDFDNIKEAREDLRIREGQKLPISAVGYVTDINQWGRIEEVKNKVDEWRKKKGFYGVIWTDLEPKGLSLNEIISYLRGLEGIKRKEAIEYIKNTPQQVKTLLRGKIERTLSID